MNDIVNELEQKNLENTTNKKIWKNNCSNCGKEKFYNRKDSLNRSIKRGNLCGSCSKKGKSKSEEHKAKISKSHMGIRHTSESKIKIRETRFKRNIKPVSGENHPQYGKRGENTIGWKGCGMLTGRYWNRVIQGAKIRNIKISITIRDAWDKFLEQNGKCALSGIDLKLSPSGELFYTGNASLDRIDSSKGYTKNNIQWIDKKINTMKMHYNQEEFIELCKLISSYKS